MSGLNHMYVHEQSTPWPPCVVLFLTEKPPSSQVGAIHPLYLYSAMSDVSLRTSSFGRRASGPTSQES
jgi:hypothetical protein